MLLLIIPIVIPLIPMIYNRVEPDLFGMVAVMGFAASRWKAGETMHHLDEWGWVAASSAPGCPGS